ncbi:MAG: uracil-DNA glycosylase [Gammaproteobacteria bacterium]|nr:uracil-DNA glycosylase [Gammaproteobacteria bacterium]
MGPEIYDPDCTLCPRLAGFLAGIRQRYPDYHARPVPPFGDPAARLVIVGLAPGLHGANATGRPFTGDFAGLLLYETLHRHGFASRPDSRHAGDGLELLDCRITNSVKCVPPQNKPLGSEVNTCNRYLTAELARLPDRVVLLALGVIAHKAALRALGIRQAEFGFAHGAEHALGRGRILLDSYHCSRYNTQTKRLTPAMFDRVVAHGRHLVDAITIPGRMRAT